MTNQPREMYRFILFLSFLLTMSLATHVFGIASTALLSVKVIFKHFLEIGNFKNLFTFQSATTFGTYIMFIYAFINSALMILAKDTHQIFQFLYSLCFIDYTLKGISTAVLGLGRKKMPCDEVFCVLGNPSHVIREFGIGTDITKAFIVIVFYIFLFHVLGFILIRYRLRNVT